MKPEAKIHTATREMVDSLLSMNVENRNIRSRVVERYKRDIEAGRWHLTNQGIGISSDGILIDGQHRLVAIKEAGYPPIQILIVSGLNKEAQKAVDQHAKRSARDMLAFSFNARVSRAAPSIASIIHRVNSTWRSQPTSQELYDIIIDYRIEIEEVVSTPSSANFFAAPFLAAFVIGYRDYNSPRVFDFMKRVENGELLTKDMPEFHLRNYIATGRKSSAGGQVQKDRFEKALKAFDCFMENKKMGVLRV